MKAARLRLRDTYVLSQYPLKPVVGQQAVPLIVAEFDHISRQIIRETETMPRQHRTRYWAMMFP